MILPSQAFAALPAGLRDPLLEEYRLIAQNYVEGKWLPSELSGGRFSEIVYTILDGHAKGVYASSPSKPQNFVQACRNLENNANEPRSFQILIPRLLPALYEIRNNRNVGHVGGDVDSNHMDATAVLSNASWIMGELIRVLHNLAIADAQQVVDQLVERRIPIVWQSVDMKRVLNPKLKLQDQVLLLIASCASQCNVDDLQKWLDYENKAYFSKILKELHSQRLIEYSEQHRTVHILPPGSKYVEGLPKEI
ncbi:hypothetical protein [Anatilimnocola floriformis]|uniref:hypothetical protein n=1 Tax=Anatilimnocola floriformis TaxID=2948575 RepID=UPI0020C2A7A6|nr:hypothetical protein [Anatilimnocola floriformis]